MKVQIVVSDENGQVLDRVTIDVARKTNLAVRPIKPEEGIHPDEYRLHIKPKRIQKARTTQSEQQRQQELRWAQQGFRPVEVTRTLPVKELNEKECANLLVHAHDCSRERQRAYLLRKAGADWGIYFNASEGLGIQHWIENEPTIQCPNCHKEYYGCRTSHHCR